MKTRKHDNKSRRQEEKTKTRRRSRGKGNQNNLERMRGRENENRNGNRRIISDAIYVKELKKGNFRYEMIKSSRAKEWDRKGKSKADGIRERKWKEEEEGERKEGERENESHSCKRHDHSIESGERKRCEWQGWMWELSEHTCISMLMWRTWFCLI